MWKSDKWFRARAKELYYRDGEIEIDSNAIISRGDDPGAYVAAWVWVPFEKRKRKRRVATIIHPPQTDGKCQALP